MDNLLHVSSSPHVRDKSSTKSIMLDVCIAMIPASVFGIVHFGLQSLVILVATVAACVLSEYVWEKLKNKPIPVGDHSAVVTGMILALNMPPQIPVWVPVLGGIFAIIVVKQLYGGLGQNFMNPALAARCFLLISFAGLMTNYSSAAIGFDSVSGATPLALLKNGACDYTVGQLFLGTIPGTIGEVSALCVLIGAAYLIVRKVISPKIPCVYIAVFAVFALIYGGFEFMLKEIFAGGLIFGAFFMATDYVTSPITPLGQTVFAVILGLLTGVFRFFGASSEGVSYAIILSNMFVPLIERVTLPKAFGKEGKKK